MNIICTTPYSPKQTTYNTSKFKLKPFSNSILVNQKQIPTEIFINIFIRLSTKDQITLVRLNKSWKWDCLTFLQNEKAITFRDFSCFLSHTPWGVEQGLDKDFYEKAQAILRDPLPPFYKTIDTTSSAVVINKYLHVISDFQSLGALVSFSKTLNLADRAKLFSLIGFMISRRYRVTFESLTFNLEDVIKGLGETIKKMTENPNTQERTLHAEFIHMLILELKEKGKLDTITTLDLLESTSEFILERRVQFFEQNATDLFFAKHLVTPSKGSEKELCYFTFPKEIYLGFVSGNVNYWNQMYSNHDIPGLISSIAKRIIEIVPQEELSVAINEAIKILMHPPLGHIANEIKQIELICYLLIHQYDQNGSQKATILDNFIDILKIIPFHFVHTKKLENLIDDALFSH